MGEEGFGYDTLFVPVGSALTYGEMSIEAKQETSHRAKALTKLALHFLR